MLPIKHQLDARFTIEFDGDAHFIVTGPGIEGSIMKRSKQEACETISDAVRKETKFKSAKLALDCLAPTNDGYYRYGNREGPASKQVTVTGVHIKRGVLLPAEESRRCVYPNVPWIADALTALKDEHRRAQLLESMLRDYQISDGRGSHLSSADRYSDAIDKLTSEHKHKTEKALLKAEEMMTKIAEATRR